MDGLWLDEEAEDDCGTGQGCLQPEDVSPGAEGDNDASNKWALSSQFAEHHSGRASTYLVRDQSEFRT